MLSHLKELIPGSEHWPHFVRNTSEQYEARLALVEVQSSPSILFQGMEGSRIPIVVAHGEGLANFSSQINHEKSAKKGIANSIKNVALSFSRKSAFTKGKRGEQESVKHIIEKNTHLIPLRYVDNHGNLTERYPQNPNGSPEGVTGFTTLDGRATIMMPHPERVFRTTQLSWHPNDWSEDSPWMRLFYNARMWVG